MKIHDEYNEAVKKQKEFVDTFNDLELIGAGRATYANDNTKSRLNEGSLATTQIESAVRVTSPLPTGMIEPTSRTNRKAAWLMNKAIKDYVLPNCNSQFSHDTKIFLIDWYSRIYGDVFVLLKWVDNDDYTGPDYEIINPRHIYPKAGVTNLEQCPDFFHLVYVGRHELEKIAKKDNTSWVKSAVKKLLKQEDAAPRQNQDQSEISSIDSVRETKQGPIGEFALVTKYSKNGEWETFARDFEEVGTLRKLTGKKMPILWKHTLPSITSIRSIGPVERGLSKQKSIEKSVNLFLDGGNMHIFPVRIFNELEKTSQLKFAPAAAWKLKYPNDYRTDRPDSSVLNNFLSMYQFLKASLLNNEGNTTTQISSSTKVPQFGKTPKALAMQTQRESTFDHLDRRMLETFYTNLIRKFVEMIQEKQVSPMQFDIYNQDVKEALEMGVISETDISEPYDELTKKGSARLIIPKEEITGKFNYVINNDIQSTEKQSQQLEAVTTFVNMYTTNPNFQAMLAQKGKEIDIAELTERMLSLAGVDNIDEILIDQQGTENMGGMEGPNNVADMGAVTQQIPDIEQLINEVSLNG